jgi:hypothetical protein
MPELAAMDAVSETKPTRITRLFASIFLEVLSLAAFPLDGLLDLHSLAPICSICMFSIFAQIRTEGRPMLQPSNH